MVAMDGGLPESRPGPGGSTKREDRDGADVYRSQARSQVFRKNSGSRGDAEPHRGSEGILRPIPAGAGAGRRPARRGPAGRVQVGVPDLGLLQHLDAGIRQIRVRGAEIRRRRVPPARHDLCGAAQGDAAPDRVRYRRGDRRQVGQGHQGAGCLHGRHPAHDQQRHLRRQRHRARDRLADASLARRVLRPRQGQDPLVGQAAVRRPHHSLSRLLARHRVRRQGHRLCAHRPAPQDPGDVAALRARHGCRGDPQHLLPQGDLQAAEGRLARAVRCQPLPRLQGDQRSRRRRFRQGRAGGRQEAHRAPGAPARREGPQGPAHDRPGAGRPLHRRGPRQPEDRRDLRRSGRGDHREEPQGAQRGRLQGAAAPRHRPRQCRRLYPQHAQCRQEHDARGRAVRHLSRHASGRAADARHRAEHVPVAVLRSRALRPLGRRPREDEHAARPRRARHHAGAAQGRHHRGDPHPGRPARRQGRDRRHRPSRQSPRALGRRADGEPVPHRLAAHGARDQGADVVGRHRHRDAAGPDQRQAGGGGGARVLRLLAALAVHGPDQPAVRDHPQAPALGARARRSHPRAGRLRGARRAPDPLRPHLPDRDAGRSQYRPDQLARHLCAGEQVRLRRDALSQGQGRPRHRRGDLPLGHGGGALHGRPGERPDRQPRALHRGHDRVPPRRRRADGPGRQGRFHGRVAEAARVGGRGAHPVPGERRRQPRADGLEHAAPGGAAGSRRGAVRRHRHGRRGGARLRRFDRRAAHRHRRPGRRHPYRRARHRGIRPDQAGRRHLSADEVPALEPEHLHQPASAGEGGRSGEEGRHHRRRSLDRARRARARPQRAGRVHAVERLQLRGLDPALRAHRQGRRLLLDPHRGIRGDGARHQARSRGNHARHSRTCRKRR